VTGGVGTAFANVIRFGFNPATLAITAVIAGISVMISRWIEAKKATEDFNKVLEATHQKLVMMNIQTRALGSATGELDVAIATIRLSFAEEINKLSQQLADLQSGAFAAAVPSGSTPELMLKQLFGWPTQKEAEEELLKRIHILEKARDAMIKGATKQQTLKESKEFAQAELALDEAIFEAGEKANEARMKARFEMIEKGIDQQFEAINKGFEELDNLDLVKLDESVSKAMDKIRKDAEDAASDMAKSFTDRFLDILEGKQVDMKTFFRDMGRTLVSEMLQEMLKKWILAAVPTQQLAGGGKNPTLGGGILGNISSLFSAFSGLSGLFGGGGFAPTVGGWYGKGGYLRGNFMPAATMKKFQHGGTVDRPTIGAIGEEGPEIVARMKPARPGDGDGESQPMNIFLVDRRPPRLGPRDGVLIVADDMERGGPTSRASINIQKRR
jgi:hypothetical protein